MNQLHAGLAALLLPLACTTACFVPDADAIAMKLVNVCRLSFGPSCAQDEDVLLEVTRREARVRVTTAEVEQCILDADCSPPEAGTGTVISCLDRNDGVAFTPEPDEECIRECAQITIDCGGGEACDLEEATACMEEMHACESRCPVVF
jgi:hypothetical protein